MLMGKMGGMGEGGEGGGTLSLKRSAPFRLWRFPYDDYYVPDRTGAIDSITNYYPITVVAPPHSPVFPPPA